MKIFNFQIFFNTQQSEYRKYISWRVQQEKIPALYLRATVFKIRYANHSSFCHVQVGHQQVTYVLRSTWVQECPRRLSTHTHTRGHLHNRHNYRHKHITCKYFVCLLSAKEKKTIVFKMKSQTLSLDPFPETIVSLASIKQY